MRNVFRKTIIFIITAMLLILASCGASEVKTDDADNGESPLTMYVGLGNEQYFEQLHDMIKQDLGIDLHYIYTNSLDTSTAMRMCAENGDLPADIMSFASTTPAEIQKDAFLELSAYSDICNLFNYSTIAEMTVDSGVYQLPFNSRLIGISYNKTLMEEMGWEVPKTLDEMKALREKCEGSGITFAKGAGAATGHGFNYLMHLMGSEWFSTPEGTEWLYDYLAGDASIDTFKEKCEYFKDYEESGLYGELLSGWDAPEFYNIAKERCLFYYALTSCYESYNGILFEDSSDVNSVVGANKDENGNIIYTESENGNVVLVDDVPTLYDENNELHITLTRYDIGEITVIDDKWASMPWPNSDGNGSFAVYNNLMISLNKDLGEPENSEKLGKAIKVLEYLASEKAINLFTNSSGAPDAYVATKSFEIDETRNYYDYREQINSGFTMPWYYLNFSNDIINYTGDAVNKLLRGEGEYDEIFTVLDKYNTANLTNTVESVVEFTETLDYPDVARLLAVGVGLGMQKALDEKEIDEEVQVALVPYMENLGDIPMGNRFAIAQTKAYKGEMTIPGMRTILPSKLNSCIAVKMTGAELNSLIEKGFDAVGDVEALKSFENAENFKPYPYAVVTKGGIEINDSEEYVVAVSPVCLTESNYESLLKNEKVITYESVELSGLIFVDTIDEFENTGIGIFIKDHPVISKSDIKWE